MLGSVKRTTESTLGKILGILQTYSKRTKQVLLFSSIHSKVPEEFLRFSSPTQK